MFENNTVPYTCARWMERSFDSTNWTSESGSLSFGLKRGECLCGTSLQQQTQRNVLFNTVHFQISNFIEHVLLKTFVAHNFTELRYGNK